MIINGTPENDNLAGTANDDTIAGLNGDDLLEAGVGNDILNGGNGDDSLTGGDGNDTLNGGNGDNVIDGGNGNDLISFGAGENIVDGGEGIDTLDLNFPNLTEDFVFTYNIFAEPSTTEGGILDGTTVESVERVNVTSGSGNDLIDIASASVGSSIAGGAGDDALIGGLGDDSIEGEAGNDTFFGAAGNDVITGGEGNDAAVFLGSAENYEVVIGENLVAVTGGFDDTPTEEDVEEETEAETEAPESFTDILSEVEIILFEDGEVIVETGEFIFFDPEADDNGEIPLVTEGTDEEIDSLVTSDDEIDVDGIPVYQFLRTDTQTQFYTTEEIERDTILETLPQYELEGISFIGAPNEDPLTGTSPVYRFFNTSTGIHLYTVDENERAFVEENLDNYTAEGTPYYGYDTQVEGTVPLYRFYNAGLDAHFYTPNTEERDFFIESPDYVAEGGDGIAFYVEPASEV